MKERDLYQPIVRGALLEGWALIRLNDGSPGRKPFDLFGCSPEGVAVGLEVKVVPKLDLHQSINWAIFEVQQRYWLQQFAKMGAISVAAFYQEDLERLVMVRFVNANCMEESPYEWQHVVTFQRLVYEKQPCFTGWDGILMLDPPLARQQ